MFNGNQFKWKRGPWVHQNTSPWGKNESSYSSQNRDQPVTGTQTVQTGRGGGGLLTGQSEIDREGMERRDRHSLTLLPCDCSLCKVRGPAEGRQMQTKRRGKGGGREWDDVRKEEKSTWVARLPMKTSEREVGCDRLDRAPGVWPSIRRSHTQSGPDTAVSSTSTHTQTHHSAVHPPIFLLNRACDSTNNQ